MKEKTNISMWEERKKEEICYKEGKRKRNIGIMAAK